MYFINVLYEVLGIETTRKFYTGNIAIAELTPFQLRIIKKAQIT